MTEMSNQLGGSWYLNAEFMCLSGGVESEIHKNFTKMVRTMTATLSQQSHGNTPNIFGSTGAGAD